MTTYYELIQLLKTTFEEDERVNNVVTGDFEQWSKDLYSIVNMNVLNIEFVGNQNTSVVRFNVIINVLDIRDVNNEDKKDRFWFNDNRHDIWNETLSILNTARNKFVKYNDGITLNTASGAEKITYAMMNGVDGWQETWTIDVEDKYTKVC